MDINKDSFDRVFQKGIKLSWYIFFSTFVFLFFWVLGFPSQGNLVSNSDLFSKIFFFLNPHIFSRVFLQGYLFSYLRNAVSEFSLVFLFSYLICFVSFFLTVFCCFWLFFISYKLGIKQFHCISCFGLFPIIGFFLISVFVFRMVVFQVEMKIKKTSRYSKIFEPEDFEISLEKEFNVSNLASRTKTSEFNLKHYDKFFGSKKKDLLHQIYEKLNSILS